jgi:hypothetical protein
LIKMNHSQKEQRDVMMFMLLKMRLIKSIHHILSRPLEELMEMASIRLIV